MPYRPAAQAEHTVAPLPEENLPVAQGEHDKAPEESVNPNEPAGQEQRAEPGALTNPYGQLLHEFSAPASLNVLAGHCRHCPAKENHPSFVGLSLFNSA